MRHLPTTVRVLAGTLALTAITSSVACGGGDKTENGALFFQTASGDMRLSGSAKLDTTFAKFRGKQGALYHSTAPVGLLIPLESADGGVALTIDVLGISEPGEYTDLNGVEVTVGDRYWAYGIYNQGCSITIDTISERSIDGALACHGLGNCVEDASAPADATRTCLPGNRLDTIDVTATFHLKDARRQPLPTPYKN